MTMTGVDPLNVDTFQIWSKVLIAWYTSYYEEESQFGISNVSSIVNFVSQDPPLSQRRGLGESRNLQSQELTMVYDQTITYQSSNSDFSPSLVIMQPFASGDSRAQFTANLKATDSDAFADITGVSGISQQGSSSTPTAVTPTTIAPTITPPVEAPTTAPIATEEPSVPPVSDPPVSASSSSTTLSTGAIIGIAVGGAAGLVLSLL
jgi:hypothetical protein